MKNTKYKKLALTALSAAVMSSFSAVSVATDDIPTYYNYIHPVKNHSETQLTWDLINQTGVYRALAYLGHALGYGWSGGTGGPYVGDDMSITYVSPTEYRIKANYNSNDPYAGGYWDHKRLEIRLDNIRYYTEPTKLDLGTAQIYNQTPVNSTFAWVTNCGNSTDEAATELRFTSSTSWSKTDDFSFNQSISIANEYEFELGFLGIKSTITATFGASQGWSETDAGSEELTKVQRYTTTMPGKTKRLVEVTVFKQTADIPYETELYLSYNATFDNFLRYSGNARNDHPTNRPTYVYKFGGTNGLNAGEDMLDQYVNRNISGYGEWDWNWMINNFGSGYMQWTLGNLSKRKFGGKMTGKFEAVDSTQFTITAGEEVPVAPGDCPSHAMDSADDAGKFAAKDFGSKLPQSEIYLDVIESRNLDYASPVKNLSLTLVEGPSAVMMKK